MATITSSCDSGTVIVMDAVADPSNADKMLQISKSFTGELRKYPENLFVAISVNPTDSGHVRIVHGWTKDSAWFTETFLKNNPLFQGAIKAMEPLLIKPRVIEHFDRIAEE